MIINKIALLVNNFIINLYDNNICFYQIILALVVLNYIVYLIVYFIQSAKYKR